MRDAGTIMLSAEHEAYTEVLGLRGPFNRMDAHKSMTPEIRERWNEAYMRAAAKLVDEEFNEARKPHTTTASINPDGIRKTLEIHLRNYHGPRDTHTLRRYNCHSAFIIDNHEEIQELKKQVAAVVDNREEIQ